MRSTLRSFSLFVFSVWLSYAKNGMSSSRYSLIRVSFFDTVSLSTMFLEEMLETRPFHFPQGSGFHIASKRTHLEFDKFTGVRFIEKSSLARDAKKEQRRNAIQINRFNIPPSENRRQFLLQLICVLVIQITLGNDTDVNIAFWVRLAGRL